MPPFNLNDVPSQKGRVAIVTGSNVGLGYETAIGLVQKEMKVVMACRNLAKAEKAKSKILKRFPKADLAVLQLDLSSLKAIRAFAKSFNEQYDRLDLLINNAGLLAPPHTLTEDGFELQMGVNYFGHFLLTQLLMDKLEASPDARVVTLSSIAHKKGSINFDDIQSKKHYDPWGAYRQSKLACLIFMFELQRRLEANNCSTISVAAHPGLSITNIAKHQPWYVKLLLPLITLFFAHSIKDGAEPTLYAALGEAVKGMDYYGPDGAREMTGHATKVKAKPNATDKAVAEKLWAISEELTGVDFFKKIHPQ